MSYGCCHAPFARLKTHWSSFPLVSWFPWCEWWWGISRHSCKRWARKPVIKSKTPNWHTSLSLFEGSVPLTSCALYISRLPLATPRERLWSYDCKRLAVKLALHKTNSFGPCAYSRYAAWVRTAGLLSHILTYIYITNMKRSKSLQVGPTLKRRFVNTRASSFHGKSVIVLAALGFNKYSRSPHMLICHLRLSVYNKIHADLSLAKQHDLSYTTVLSSGPLPPLLSLSVVSLTAPGSQCWSMDS